jgi:hypothetical protein
MEILEMKTVTKQVITGYKCDNCNKKIKASSFPKDWHKFNSYHTDWSNDIYDTMDEHEVCSPECYKEGLTIIVKNEMTYIKSGVIDKMHIDFARKLIKTF